jgi:hypothetical protein
MDMGAALLEGRSGRAGFGDSRIDLSLSGLVSGRAAMPLSLSCMGVEFRTFA